MKKEITFYSQQKQGKFSFFTTTTWIYSPLFSLTQWVPVALFLGVRRAGAEPSHPHDSEVRIASCLILTYLLTYSMEQSPS